MKANLSWLARRRSRKSQSSRPVLGTGTDGVRLGNTKAGKPVIWEHPTRQTGAHLALGGTTGSGKSIMLGAALARRIATERETEAHRRQSYLIVDAKGDTAQAVVQAIAYHCPERIPDIEWLDPFGVGFPANVCRLDLPRAEDDTLGLILANLVAAVSKGAAASGAGGVGARQSELLAACFRAVVGCKHPAASALWIVDALQTDDGPSQLAALTQSQPAARALVGRKIAGELAASTSSRLSTAFAYTSLLERMVSATSCVPFTELLGPGKITILDLGTPPAGAVGLVSFHASLWATVACQLALSRPSNRRDPILNMVFEECPLYANALADLWITLLQTGRSRGVATTFVLQNFKMLSAASPALLSVLHANARMCAGRLASTDADVLVRQLAIAPGVEESVGAMRTRVAGQLTNLREREFVWFGPHQRDRFRSRPEPIDKWEAAAAKHEAEISVARQKWGQLVPTSPRTTLEEAIALSKAQTLSARPRAVGADGDKAKATTRAATGATPWD